MRKQVPTRWRYQQAPAGQTRALLSIWKHMEKVNTSPGVSLFPGTQAIFPRSSTDGKILVLNGFPGTGKLTILNKLQALLPVGTTRLLDNHLIIDPVVAVFPDRCDQHHDLRRAVRAPIYAKLGKLAQQGYTILMTACLAANNDRDARCFQEHLNMVRGTGVPMFWISVHCEESVLKHRVASTERSRGSKTKLTDVEILGQLLLECHLIEPDGATDPAVNLVVDNMDVTGPAEDSAQGIMTIMNALPKP